MARPAHAKESSEKNVIWVEQGVRLLADRTGAARNERFDKKVG
jgi:hypothetical protein